MTQVEISRETVRVRTEGQHILLTLTPQQADELADVIRHSSAETEEWMSEAAQTLALTAGQLDPSRLARRRRPLRIAAGAPVHTPATQPAAQSASTRGVAAPLGPQPVAKPRSGLAAAVAEFADAISPATSIVPPAAEPAAKPRAQAPRGMTLQEILEAAAAARTSKAEPANV